MKTAKHDYNKLRVVLGFVIAGLGVFAIYMSWGALSDLAIAYLVPPDRAWAFPLIIDLPAIIALVISMTITDSHGYGRALPWVVFGIFGGATILGNAEVVSRIPAEDLPTRDWTSVVIAILVHSAPSIAALATAHLGVETVYRSDRWTAKPVTVSASSKQSTNTPSTSVPPHSSRKSRGTTAEKRALVESLVDQGLTAPEILLQNPSLARSSVFKWVAEHTESRRTA